MEDRVYQLQDQKVFRLRHALAATRCSSKSRSLQLTSEGALKNLRSELNHWNFDKVRSDAAAAWNSELNKIQVTGGSDAQLTNFYTALYHAMTAPNLFMDVDGRYRGRDFKTHVAEDFTNYTVFSLWDTFRAAHPLYTIIDQKRTRDFIKTFLVAVRARRSTARLGTGRKRN